MTFCLAMKVKDGIVGISDTRVTSGKECMTAKKVTVRKGNGSHAVFVMTSGLRSLRDKAITYFHEIIEEEEQTFDKLYKMVNALGEQVKRVAREDRESLEAHGLSFNLYALVAGQLEKDTEPMLYMLYPEGNWVEVGEGSPYFIIGNTGHGRPMLDRVLRYDSTMEFALKVGFLSFNATRVSSNDVEYPIDVVICKKDSFHVTEQRFDRDDMQRYSVWWQERIAKSVHEMPDEWVNIVFNKDQLAKDEIMLLNIRHVTSYTYDHPVILEPHCLRLTPRADCYGSLLERRLNIVPKPSHVSTSVENDGSISHWVRFEGETKIFTVESKACISLITDKNPFDFLIYPEACFTLPMVYPPEVFRELRAFLGNNVASAVRDFAFEVLIQSKGHTIDFLVMLSQRMKRDFVYEFRPTGVPHQAEDTLISKRGSCRDWAILYMAAANSVGLAARFVSGYYFDENPELPDLHAWVEVYIPGGGWRGFDPSLGLACYGHHIALATSASAKGAAPIQGIFKGHAQSEMKLELEYEYSSVPVVS